MLFQPLLDDDWCRNTQSNAINHLNVLTKKPRQEYEISTVVLGRNI